MGQESLKDVVTNCKKRLIGSQGGFGYSSLVDSYDIAIMESMILAYWLCATTKEKNRSKVSVIKKDLQRSFFNIKNYVTHGKEEDLKMADFKVIETQEEFDKQSSQDLHRRTESLKRNIRIIYLLKM